MQLVVRVPPGHLIVCWGPKRSQNDLLFAKKVVSVAVPPNVLAAKDLQIGVGNLWHDAGICRALASAGLLTLFDAHIIAIDFLPDFLDVLRARAAREGVADPIEAVNASMDALPIEPGSLDAIWVRARAQRLCA